MSERKPPLPHAAVLLEKLYRDARERCESAHLTYGDTFGTVEASRRASGGYPCLGCFLAVVGSYEELQERIRRPPSAPIEVSEDRTLPPATGTTLNRDTVPLFQRLRRSVRGRL